MTIDVFIPAIGQQDLLDRALQYLTENSHTLGVNYTVIDNGSKVPLTAIVGRVIRNESNLGMVRSLQQAVENSEADIVVYMHSDMYIYQSNWDALLVSSFLEDDKLAAVGVVGAIQADANGGRSGTICAFRGGEAHGAKPLALITPVALLDGCFMAFRRAVLENLDWDKFEENGYLFSYDKDLTLTLTMDGWHVGAIDLESEHLGGRTSCHKEFNDTLAKQGTHMDAMYAESERRYIEKWKACLPVRVRHDWHVDAGIR